MSSGTSRSKRESVFFLFGREFSKLDPSNNNSKKDKLLFASGVVGRSGINRSQVINIIDETGCLKNLKFNQESVLVE